MKYLDLLLKMYDQSGNAEDRYNPSQIIFKTSMSPVSDYNADPMTNSVSFKYKSSITGKTTNANKKDGENTEQEIQRLRKIMKLLFHQNI